MSAEASPAPAPTGAQSQSSSKSSSPEKHTEQPKLPPCDQCRRRVS